MTGCAGFIGSHLSERLLNEGHLVRGVDCFTDYYARSVKMANLRAPKMSGAFEFVQADLATSSLGRLVKGVDAVFHLAAQPGVRASWGKTFSHYVEDNVVATQRLLEALKGSSLKVLVYASSSSVYGDSERMPTPEDVTPKPVSPYGATKLAGESLCHVYFRNYSVPVVALRYFTVYGPRQRPDMAFHRFIERISNGKEIDVFGDGEQRRDFTYVGDIVAGSISALNAAPGSVYNLGAGRSVTLNEVIRTIELVMGRRARVRRLPTVPGDVRSTSADIRRASNVLGYVARTALEDGLREQVEHQKRGRMA